MQAILEKLEAMFGEGAVVSLELNRQPGGIHVAKLDLSPAQFLGWMAEPRLPFEQQGLKLVGFMPEPFYDVAGNSVLLMRNWEVIVKFWG